MPVRIKRATARDKPAAFKNRASTNGGKSSPLRACNVGTACPWSRQTGSLIPIRQTALLFAAGNKGLFKPITRRWRPCGRRALTGVDWAQELNRSAPQPAHQEAVCKSVGDDLTA